MIWKLLARLRLVQQCSHCDEWFFPWQWSSVRGGPGFLRYCRKCFEYYARDDWQAD